MGGCYETSRSYADVRETQRVSNLESSLRSFFGSGGNTSDLIAAQKAFEQANSSGFIKRLLEYQRCTEAPKEFPEIEYEVKVNVGVSPEPGIDKDPELRTYLKAFQFPIVENAGFLKDQVNSIAVGINHFWGEDEEERLVFIEKGGKFYLKEKSQPLPLQTKVPYQEVVMKRTERRYETTVGAATQKISEVVREGARYAGKITKEKGDDFIFDTEDGRIFSFTVTRSRIEDRVQRQLEIEYAGYVPGFKNFKKDSEEQIVSDMVELTRYVGMMHQVYGVSALGSDLRMSLQLSSERKYDFVRGKASKRQLYEKRNGTIIEPLRLVARLIPLKVGE